MTGPDPRLVDEIFTAALDRDEAERADWVAERCGDDPALRQRVRALLAAAASGSADLDGRYGDLRNRLLRDVLADDGDEAAPAEDLSGRRIGAWRIERRLARGGLATVYFAQRDDGEYSQQAAFKVMRRGLDTDDLVARFRAEREILSTLRHPSIAGILDGGALDDGRPYLVLEYVDGQPITGYCESRRLPVRDRVRLMMEVLRALHHAHRHLIVHRDIKPSNILVSSTGHVSLLDFGIAKLLDPGAVPGASTLTRTGMSLLTPGYCSPEQHAGEAVTTASDVYQAGAVLYEVLTGRRPQPAADADTVSRAPSRELRDQPSFADVRGDLDAVVQMAMHAEPSRRYASADKMQADLEHFLDGRPVIARPDTLAYRLAKFAKRRPLALPAMVAIGIAIAGYVYTLQNYNEQLRREQQRASSAQQFMIDILASPDPFRPADPDLGSDITVVEALDLGADSIDESLAGDAELRASVLASIATVYASLDQHEKAIDLRERALALQRELHGEPSADVLESVQALARLFQATGYHEAAALYAGAQLDSARSLFADDDPELGKAMVIAAELEIAAGRTDAARTLYDQAIARLRATGGDHARNLVNALVARAELDSFPNPDHSLVLLEEARGLASRVYGEQSLPMGEVRAQLGLTYSVTRDYALAEPEMRAAIDIYEARLGRNHGATLVMINDLGILYNRMGDPVRAEEKYREVLERYLAKHGPEHRTVADSYQNLATALTRSGQYDESIPMHTKAFEIYERVLPAEQEVLAYPLLSRAYAEVHSGRFPAAEQTARAALDILERTAQGTYLVGVAECLAALALEGRGDTAAGESMLARSHESLIGSVVSDTYRRACRVPAT